MVRNMYVYFVCYALVVWVREVGVYGRAVTADNAGFEGLDFGVCDEDGYYEADGGEDTVLQVLRVSGLL